MSERERKRKRNRGWNEADPAENRTQSQTAVLITVSGADPQPLTGDEERSDADEGEAEFPRSQHLGYVGLDVDVLQVLMRVSVVKAKRRVQTDRNPDAVT